MFGQSKLSAPGSKYSVNGVVFLVLGVGPSLIDGSKEISQQYVKFPDFPPGVLVAISHRGVLIPNLIFDDGSARLTEIEVNGMRYNTPRAISDVLGINTAMWQYDLYAPPI